MEFVRKLIVMVEHWGCTEANPYHSFVDEQSERMVELVIANAAQSVENARRQRFGHRPVESDFISALIDKLQEAGF